MIQTMKYLGLLLCFTIAVNAQDGSADINWGNLPFNELNFKGCNGNISGALDRNEVYAIAEQADGKFLIGGGFSFFRCMYERKGSDIERKIHSVWIHILRRKEDVCVLHCQRGE